MATKLTHKQRIEKAHIALMRNKDTVWLAPVCMIGKVTIDPDIPTAGTDGKNVIYGSTFLDKLNDAQVRATVVHENFHKMYMHLIVHEFLVKRYTPRFGLEQARMLVNQAQDYVINRSIKKMAPFCETWDGIIKYCYDPKYDDEHKWDTVKIAEDLANQAQQGGGKGQGQPGEGDSQDFHDWAAAQGMDEKETEALGKQIEQALRQGEVLAKKMQGNMPRDIGDLLAPAVDWRQALRDFVTERAKGGDYATYAKPNRRYVGVGMYMPSTYTETVQSVLFAVDTSGSIGPEDLNEVLAEIQGCLEVVRPETVDIIYWNSGVARHEHYAGEDVYTIMGSTKPEGTGGTEPSCVIPFCQERGIKPSVAIWLSDGYVGSDWAEGLNVPAFWVISSGGCVPSHLPHVLLPNRRQ